MVDRSRKILLIDNDTHSEHFLYRVVKGEAFVIDRTADGEEGFKRLLAKPKEYSSIVLGRNIKHVDSITLLHRINACSLTKSLPIIMEAEVGTPEEMEACIRAGARYYFSKPINNSIALEVIKTAARDHDRYFSAEESIHGELKAAPLMVDSTFRFQSLGDGQALANFLAESTPNPRLAVVGLSEMLVNAIEHGNLGITYEEKSKLHDSSNWLDEVERRTRLPENKDKWVTVNFEKQETHIKIRIVDQGKGFDWQKFQQLDSSRVFDNHGRGIVMAKTLAFETLEYIGKGNEVICSIRLTPDSDSEST